MALLIIVKDTDGNVIGELLAKERIFRTGSRGYYANSKLEYGGKRYQAQVQLVEIGSKPSGKKDA